MIAHWIGGISNSPDMTSQLGSSLAMSVKAGNVFGLDGDLGAGKTTFVKGFLNGLGCRINVTSPTFTLVNQYDTEPVVYHIDCYRETNPVNWIKLGINDYIHEDSIVLIEWYKYIEKILPLDMIKINFDMVDYNTRKIYLI